jgi:3-hydroxyacyl-CoA dehydrogenase
VTLRTGDTHRPVAVAGAGSIGVAFAALFAAAGRAVRCWDPLPEALERARRDLHDRLLRLDKHGLLGEPVETVAGRVSFEGTLAAAVHQAVLVQECAPERLELKRALLADIAALAPHDAVLASSTSAILPSRLAGGCPAADRVLVGHPGNPPYLLPVIEVVAGAQTSPSAVAAARAVYRSAGLTTVTLHQEVEGFVFNRLQGALLREAYCLVRDGVADVADVDAIVRLGLGRRWSVVGPFETADLNTRGGLAAHAERMGPAYHRMGLERGQDDPWTPELVGSVVAQRRAALPIDEWADRVAWRDEQLMKLVALDRPELP